MTALVYECGEGKGVYGTLLSHPKDAASRKESYQKWLMLAILSLLSAINQSICYSYAPIASIIEDRWEQRLPSEHLITVFFISYIPCSFIGSWVMDKYGLRLGVLLGGFLQAIGASLRYFACTLDSTNEIYMTIIGQTVASLAIAVHAPFIVFSSTQVPIYNFYVAIVSIIAWIIASFWFLSSPEFRPSVPNSAAHDEYDWGQWKSAFTHTGFWHTLVVFSLAECVFNTMSALLGKFLSAAEFSKPQVGLVGAAFVLSSLLGGQLISHYVDKKRNHKTAMQICLLLTASGLVLFRVVPKVKIHATLACLLFLGAVLGPLQPIGLELGVECAYPTSEATVAALQQLLGNFFSAIVVPALSSLQRRNLQSTNGITLSHFYGSPEWIMSFMAVGTLIVFCFFDGEHKRFQHETKIVLPRNGPNGGRSYARIPEDSTS